MLIYILVGFLAIIILFLIFVALQPNDFRITRAATVAAPPAIVFEQVNDLHKWNAWSPWARMDPDARNTYEGPVAGVGASFAWAGNKKVGEGRMTITDSQPCERIGIKLEFFKPFVATNRVDFTFKPDGDQTEIVWEMSGKNSFVGKIFTLLMSCDKMIGSQFEQGFSNLKSIVEIPVAT